MSDAPNRLHLHLRALEDTGQSRKALTLLFECIDTWMTDGEWDLVREVLRTVHFDKYSITVAIGFATSTFSAKGHSIIADARTEFMCRLATWLREKDPSRADALLNGLA